MSLTYCAFFLEAFLAAFSAFFEAFFIMMSCFTALIFLRATGGIFFRVSLSSGVTLMQEQEQEQVLQSVFFSFFFFFSGTGTGSGTSIGVNAGSASKVEELLIMAGGVSGF